MASVSSLLDSRSKRKLEEAGAIEAVLKRTTDESEQLDEIAKINNYFMPEAGGNADVTIKAYMAGELSLQETIPRLANPIDDAYSTGSNGRDFWSAEQAARNQRKFYSPEKAAEIWGFEQDFPKPDEEDDNYVSTEMLLWDLYYAVVHTARKIHWKDEPKQTELLVLLKTLKSRPDPPLPQGITKALRNHWIYGTGTLWSNLSMLGPSFREAWNDSPGCGAGWYAAEVRSWTNLNAFTARLCNDGVVEFWSFCLWAMDGDLCGTKQGMHVYAPLSQRQNAAVPTAAVWVFLAGSKIFNLVRVARGERDEHFEEDSPYDITDGFTIEAWQSWKKAFATLSSLQTLDEDVRQIAREAVQEMEAIDTESEWTVL